MKTYQGSCHCGEVRYQVDIDLSKGTSKCNCTYCTKVRSWKAFVKPAEFRLMAGDTTLKNYHQGPHAGLKFFCDRCGVTTHESGHAVWSGGDYAAVFLATLDDAEPAELISAPVHVFNGREDKWEGSPEETRHL